MIPPTLRAPLVLCSLAIACQQTPAARYGSSANEPAYAERYAGSLSAARESHVKDETFARQTSATFAGLPGELKAPDWNAVQRVVELADAAGKSGDYVQAIEESRLVTRFYAEEKQGLQQKVGGSVAYTAKEKQCDADFYGSVSGALDRAMEKTLERRLRDHNPAQRYIEDHAEALGEANVPKLEKRADEIALASYIVNVHLPDAKQELDALLAEASDVKATLERQQTEAQAVQADAKASAAAKKLAKQRLGLDGAISGAEQASKELEQRAETARSEYQKAFDAMVDVIEFEAKANPPAVK
jgi:hypothetical protein